MITIRILAKAIERGLGHPAAVATEEARTVLNYFGFKDTIIDNAIEPEDRKLFYALHDGGLLQSSWETVPLLDGRHWRIFYWHFDTPTIERMAASREGPGEEHLYQDLPAEAWTHPPSTT